ncbi:MAG: hypothetical protein ACRCWF_04320 [Beijerinckiaceae bacterium]
MLRSGGFNRLAIIGILAVVFASCTARGRPYEFKAGTRVEQVLSDQTECGARAQSAKLREEAKHTEPFAQGLFGARAFSLEAQACYKQKGYTEKMISDENAAFFDSLPTARDRLNFLAVIGSGGTIESYKQRFGQPQS